MKKKILSQIAALSIAAVTALPTLSLVSSADVIINDSNVASGTVYKATVFVDGVGHYEYYTTESDALAAAGNKKDNVSSEDIASWGNIYISGSRVYKTATDGATGYKTGSSGSTTSGNYSDNGHYNGYSYAGTVYLSDITGRYYPNLQAYLNDPANATATRTPTAYPSLGSNYDSSTGYVYFNVYTGTYTNVASDETIRIGSSNSSISSSSTASSTYPWYSSYTGRYYKTQADARAVSLYDSQVSYVGNSYYGYYYSSKTGQYYTTYAAALAASDNASQVSYVGNYYNDYYYYNGYYGYYYDPYYYYYYYRNNDSSSSSSSTGTLTITSSSSWTTLANRIKLSSSVGKTISVDMKSETIVPSSVFTALKGRDVTVSLKLDNGVIYTINGKNVTSTKDVNLLTTYNTDRIPSSLVKKAYQKYNAVSTAQISVNSNSFGAKAGITVKFSTKRAGCTARLYRYNSDKRTLSLVDTSVVTSAGQCTFNGVAKGGDFVVVLS